MSAPLRFRSGVLYLASSWASSSAWAAYVLAIPLGDMIPELKVSQGVSLFPKLVNMMGCILDCNDVLIHEYTAVIRLSRMKEEPIHYWGVPLPDRGTWAECTS